LRAGTRTPTPADKPCYHSRSVDSSGGGWLNDGSAKQQTFHSTQHDNITATRTNAPQLWRCREISPTPENDPATANRHRGSLGFRGRGQHDSVAVPRSRLQLCSLAQDVWDHERRRMTMGKQSPQHQKRRGRVCTGRSGSQGANVGSSWAVRPLRGAVT